MVRFILFSFAISILQGCQPSGTWRSNTSAMEFKVPINFTGVVLIAGQGRPLVFDDLLILVGNLEHLGKVRDVGVNRFIRGNDIFIERSSAILFLPDVDLSEFAVWGKTYIKILPDSPDGFVAEELGCGYEFAIYFVGTGADAKVFFNNSSAFTELMSKNLEKSRQGNQNSRN